MDTDVHLQGVGYNGKKNVYTNMHIHNPVLSFTLCDQSSDSVFELSVQRLWEDMDSVQYLVCVVGVCDYRLMSVSRRNQRVPAGGGIQGRDQCMCAGGVLSLG